MEPQSPPNESLESQSPSNESSTDSYSFISTPTTTTHSSRETPDTTSSAEAQRDAFVEVFNEFTQRLCGLPYNKRMKVLKAFCHIFSYPNPPTHIVTMVNGREKKLPPPKSAYPKVTECNRLSRDYHKQLRYEPDNDVRQGICDEWQSTIAQKVKYRTERQYEETFSNIANLLI
ncbi:hypothetical protein DICA4_C00518 [Diutina catenulata]